MFEGGSWVLPTLVLYATQHGLETRVYIPYVDATHCPMHHVLRILEGKGIKDALWPNLINCADQATKTQNVKLEQSRKKGPVGHLKNTKKNILGFVGMRDLIERSVSA